MRPEASIRGRIVAWAFLTLLHGGNLLGTTLAVSGAHTHLRILLEGGSLRYLTFYVVLSVAFAVSLAVRQVRTRGAPRRTWRDVVLAAVGLANVLPFVLFAFVISPVGSLAVGPT